LLLFIHLWPKVRSTLWVNMAESRNFLTTFSESLLCAI
jgi:hypothetical protein